MLEIDRHKLLVHEAKRWVRFTESGGDNRGQVVEMFQRAVDGKAQGEAWCFEGSTEVLTEDGWIRFDELSDELIAQVTSKENIQFVEPYEYIKKPYKGKAYHVKGSGLDLVCDKNHRFYGYFNGAKQPKLAPLSKVTSHLSIPSLNIDRGDMDISDYHLKFLAAFLGDGFLSQTRQGKPRIRIQVSKERKLTRLNSYEYIGKYLASKAYGISKSPLTTFSFEVPEIFNFIFSDYKVLTWDFVHNLSMRQALLFLNEYLIFDGSPDKNIIFSSNEMLVDQLICIAQVAGYLPRVRSYNSLISGRPCWSIRWAPNKKSKFLRPNSINEIDYDGYMYCVSVPSEKIIVRGPNKVPTITGNCMSFAQYCLLQVDLLVNELANQTLAGHKIYKSEHCWTTFNKTHKSAHRMYAEPGFLAIWKQVNSTSGHVGIVLADQGEHMIACEGNTSPGAAGSQRDGDGVFIKKRTKGMLGNMDLQGYLDPWPRDLFLKSGS